MTDKQQPVNGSRRTFFRSLAALGVASGGGALLLRQGLASEAPSEGASAPAASKGYSETDHIRKYYDTARG